MANHPDINDKMANDKIVNMKAALRPYADVIIFMITLFAANYFWKWTVSGDENGDLVTWLGWDVTAPF